MILHWALPPPQLYMDILCKTYCFLLAIAFARQIPCNSHYQVPGRSKGEPVHAPGHSETVLLPFLEKSEADLSPLLPWISPPLAMRPMIALCFVSPHTFFGAWQFSGLFCEPPSTCYWYLQHNPAGRTVQGPWQPAASNPEAKMLPSPLVQLCRIQVDFYGFLTVSDGRI